MRRRRPRVLTPYGRRMLGVYLVGWALLVYLVRDAREVPAASQAPPVAIGEPGLCLPLEAPSCPGSEHSEAEVRLLAKVLCAECKGCADPWERIAIGYVVLNRANSGVSWWGDTVKEVLLKPGQFAPASAAICKKALPPRADGRPWSPGMVEQHRTLMGQIDSEARMVLFGEVYDPVEGTFFHARRLGPIWPRLEEIDVPKAWSHRFYRVP